MPDDDRDLFEKALESMSRGDVFRGKFGQPAEPSTTTENPDDAGSREQIQRRREERQMEDAFSGVVPIDQGKYHVRPPEDVIAEKAGADDVLRAEFEAAMKADEAPPEDETLVPLEQLASADVHSLNVRGMAPGAALGKLGLFVDFAAKEGHELVRVRIGTNPELLNAVKQWFLDAGLVYTDRFEVAQEHADAAIFAQLRHSPKG